MWRTCVCGHISVGRKLLQPAVAHCVHDAVISQVGVDVANASIIVIQHAERFGLSQLHQLRGRVGRGTKPSLCYMMCANKNLPRVQVRETVLLLYRTSV